MTVAGGTITGTLTLTTVPLDPWTVDTVFTTVGIVVIVVADVVVCVSVDEELIGTDTIIFDVVVTGVLTIVPDAVVVLTIDVTCAGITCVIVDKSLLTVDDIGELRETFDTVAYELVLATTTGGGASGWFKIGWDDVWPLLITGLDTLTILPFDATTLDVLLSTTGTPVDADVGDKGGTLVLVIDVDGTLVVLFDVWYKYIAIITIITRIPITCIIYILLLIYIYKTYLY